MVDHASQADRYFNIIRDQLFTARLHSSYIVAAHSINILLSLASLLSFRIFVAKIHYSFSFVIVLSPLYVVLPIM